MTISMRFLTGVILTLVVVNGAVAEVVTSKVKAVTSGERLSLENGEEIRLLGVKAPVPGVDKSATERNEQAAKVFLESLVKGKDLSVMYFPTSVEVKPKERLAYILAGSVLVNAEMIGAGYATARSEKKPHLYAKELRRLEDLARRNGNGLWAAPGSGEEKSSSARKPRASKRSKSPQKRPDFVYTAPSQPRMPQPSAQPQAPPFKQVTDDGTIILQTPPLPKTPEYERPRINLDIDVFVDDAIKRFLRDRIDGEERRDNAEHGRPASRPRRERARP